MMMQKLLLPIVAAVVLSVATPSFATFWNHDEWNWDFDWSELRDQEWDHNWDQEWDTKHEWPNLSGVKEWLEDKDWSRDGHDWGRCGNDNPVPEPATMSRGKRSTDRKLNNPKRPASLRGVFLCAGPPG